MINLRVAHRYAEALLSSADALHVLKQVSEDLTLMKRIIKESREFHFFLKSPVIKKEKKQEIFRATFGSAVQPLTLQFLSLLIEKEREDVLPSIIDAFFQRQDEKLDIIHVQVKTAVELSQQQTEQLIQRFESLSKKKVQIDMSIDKQLLGGFIARIGDTVFDGSVKRQLELLHKRFTEERVVVQ